MNFLSVSKSIEIVLLLLLLPNTDHLQQVTDYVRGCPTSTKYWPPSTS